MADQLLTRTSRVQKFFSKAQVLLRPLAGPIGYLSRGLHAGAYPVQGIWYFLRHREYYPLFIGRLLPLSLISLFVYTILFTFTFLPQLALLALWQGRAALFNAVVLVLGEGLVIIQGLFEGFFVDECRVDAFDVSLHIPCSYKTLPIVVYPYFCPRLLRRHGEPTGRAPRLQPLRPHRPASPPLP